MIISIDGVNLHYEVFGEGRPILLLHGWGGCVNAMAPIWQFLKEKFKVYVIDFPGQNNESSDPPVPWSIPDYAKLIEDFMACQAIEKPDVVAHSFGGRVAIFLASQNKDLFHRMVLIDSAGVKPKETIKKKLRKIAFSTGKKMIKLIYKGEKYQKKIDKLRSKYASSDYRALQTDVMRQTFQNVVNLDLTPYLKQIQSATLLIWGENDIDTPVDMAKVMEKEIPDAGLVVIPKVGHFSYLEASERVNRIIDEFFK